LNGTVNLYHMLGYHAGGTTKLCRSQLKQNTSLP